MSLDWQGDIEEMEEVVFEKNWPLKPTIPNEFYKDLRIRLITEEVNETLEAIKNDDMVELADGIADAIVVLLGTAVTYGIDIRPIWNEVHRTNMAKVGGETRADGKRLKPKGWLPPDIKSILIEQGMVE